jgi:DNA-binding response OmpR family regulator
MKTILVVDDAPNIVELLRMYLEGAGYATVVATDGPAAVEAHRKHRPDLVILDLMLPGMDGFEVCRAIRREADTPVLMLTARTDDVDAIVGLELGADDYVTKPFNPRALGPGAISAGPTDGLAPRSRRRPDRAPPAQVIVGDRGAESWAREFDSRRPGPDPGVATSREALEDVGGTDFARRTVDVHVSELRKKLGDDGPTIESVRGVGYRLIADA